MAAILTPEQREQKRKRDADYRARKAAQKNRSDLSPIQQFDVLIDPKVEKAMQGLLAGKVSISEFVKIEQAVPDAFTFEEVVLVKVGKPTMRDLVLAAQLGDTVFAPVTQLYAEVQKTFRGGGRLLTEDGENIWANVCGHSTEERANKGTVIFWEQVGNGNKDFADGVTGFAHRFSRCNKVVQ